MHPLWCSSSEIEALARLEVDMRFKIRILSSFNLLLRILKGRTDLTSVHVTI